MPETRIQLWCEREVDQDFDPRERETLLKKQLWKKTEFFEQLLGVILVQEEEKKRN